jgi:hypothetical protein
VRVSSFKSRKFFILSLTFLIISSVVFPTITSIAPPPPDDFYSYEIEFIDWELLDDMNVKFTYRVKSGGKPSISHWELWSCCFSREDMIIDASEPYELDTNKHMLKFDEGYYDYEERTVWFVIHIVDYKTCGIGTIDFEVKGGQYEDYGTITGPSCQPDFYIPENPLGTLGAIIPLLAALGLVIASKKKIITITVEK